MRKPMFAAMAVGLALMAGVTAGLVTATVMEAMADTASAPAAVTATPMADEEERVLERTFTFMAGEELAVAETLEQDGATWTLVRVSEPAPDPSFVPEERRFTYEEKGTFATAEEASAAFPETRGVAEDGFAGEIPRTGFEVGELLEEWIVVEDRVDTYGPYPTNDVAQLPTAARQGGVSWEVAERSSLGVPVSYVATVTTKVAQPRSRVVGYEVTATYEGVLAKDEQRMMVTAVYRAPVSVPTAETTAAAGGRIRGQFPAGAAVAGGTVAALAFGLLVFVRMRNVTVCVGPEERVQAKVRATRVGEELQVVLPARVRLDDGVVLYLRENLCDGGALAVKQAGIEVLRGTAVKRVMVSACRAEKEAEVQPQAQGEAQNLLAATQL